jgi:CheY-like chemotaxis protein
MRASILVVDDERDICNTLADILRDEGYDVHCAYGAEEGLAILERADAAATLPQLCLVDLLMPGMSGEEFRRRQLASPRLAAIPTMLMSAMVMSAKMRDFAPASGTSRDGGVEWVEKPFVLDRLLETIGTLIARTRPTTRSKPAPRVTEG